MGFSMNILLASDDNYAPLLGVTIYSLLKNNEADFNKINLLFLMMVSQIRIKINYMIFLRILNAM